MTPFQILVLQALYYILRGIRADNPNGTSSGWHLKSGHMIETLRKEGWPEEAKPPEPRPLALDTFKAKFQTGE